MKKFLRRLARPLPFVVLAASSFAALFIDRDYFLPLAVVLGAHLLIEAVDFFFESQLKRRKGPEAVKDNLIEVYVDDATFVCVEQMADIVGLSVPVFCSCALQALELDDFADFKPDEEDDYGQ